MSHFDVGRESEPYDLFLFAINAEQTREKYVTRLKKFFEIIGIDLADNTRKMQLICEQSKL